MAEEKLMLEEKLTEPCESPSALSSPYERPGSNLSSCEKKQTLGGSNQPSRATGNGFQAETLPEPLKRDDSYPSSLHSTSTCTTYSLEISVSTNKGGTESQPLPLKTPPESGDGQGKDTSPLIPLVPPCGDKKPDAPETNLYRVIDSKMDKNGAQFTQELTECQDNLGSLQIVTGKSPSTISGLEKTIVSSPRDDRKLEAQPLPSSYSTHNDKGPVSDSQEMKDTFYAFVIMHAEEDTNEAVRLRKKLESISTTIGATFSEDFEQPGWSIFSCVEDAIENSAYTMLLLTSNFKTRLNETNTDSVLMNSFEKKHKYNTVIPLIPKRNRLTRSEMPLVLKTKNALDETKKSIFEKHVRKLLDQEKISEQKSLWSKEQQQKKEQEKEQMLQQEIRHQKEVLRESARVRKLEEQKRQLEQQQEKQGFLPPSGPQASSPSSFQRHAQPVGPVPSQWCGQMPPNYSMNMWQLPPSNIHIQNASYIMIGNDSTMTVGGAVDSGDED